MDRESKPYIIIIMILLFIIGCATGYIIANTKNGMSENVEEKKEKVEDKKEVISGILESNGSKETVEISLNGSEKTLTLYNRFEENKDSILTFGDTDINYYIGYGADIEVTPVPEKVNYNVVVGKDNKEYLVVTYGYSFQQFLIVLNKDAKVIGKYSTYYEDTKFFGEHDNCYAIEEVNDVFTILYSVEDNDIYFYKYDEGTLRNLGDGKNSIDLEQIKIEIDNDKLIETKTGSTKKGSAGQCD